MSSRPYVVHRVSTTEPTGQQLGDEWFNPATNVLTKTLSVNGNVVTAAQVPVTVGNVTSAPALSVTGTVTAGSVTAGNIQTSGTMVATGSVSSANTFGFKNRIINGDMRIDQRNAGAPVTINSTTITYGLDRWAGYGQPADGVFTMERSVLAPTGFNNSLLVTVTTADASVTAGQTYNVLQYIEGLNTADLAWGTSSAQTVTLSFWVRSLITGIFSGSLRNNSANRGYAFTYQILAPLTWEFKTVTIPGDTTGTWLTDSANAGVQVWFSLGTGSALSAAPGVWTASNITGATGAVNLISNIGATWALTGVQFEIGTVATKFDLLDPSTELLMCMRYCQKFNVFPTNGFDNFTSYFGGSNAVATVKRLSVPMRSVPIAAFTNAAVDYYSFGGVWTGSTLQASISSNEMYYIFIASDGDGRGKLLRNGGGGGANQPTVTFTSELP